MIAASSPLAKGWPVLVRREFWEHRSLWITPLVMAALYLLACVLTGAFATTRGVGGPVSVNGSPILFAQFMFTAAVFGLMSVVLFFYLADCLYAERKDRSILFWKSLPVSDTATVLTKLAVALLIVPLGVLVLTFVTNLVGFGILYVRLHNDAVLGPLMRWDTEGWLHLNGISLLYVLILALWYAPVAAYQLLVSAWAKSSVLVWTVLPPLVLVFGERLLFGTWYVWATIRDRLGMNITGVASGHRHAGLFSRVLSDNIHVAALLTAPAMWIGIILAAALVFAAIRIRRYRDDS